MSETIETLKSLAPAATPFVPLIVDIFIKPRLERFARRIKGFSASSVADSFEEYLRRTYSKHSFIPILIFQNDQRRLDDIYIPLTLSRMTSAGKQTFVIDGYPLEFLPAFEKVLISDTAGMGKSTLMKRLFLSALEQNQGVPVFIELRKVAGSKTIVDFVVEELNEINDEFDKDFVLNMIADGDFIFFFDGYDEISLKERDKVTSQLLSFISKTEKKNLFIVTSRPDPALSAFPGFVEFEIEPLEKNEAFSLIRKYDDANTIAESIIAKLKGKTLTSVEEFLTNPLLVSLLYKSYEYKKLIPLKKSIFYRQVFDALYESHDLTKEGWTSREKQSGLDIDGFHGVMRSLAFLTIKHGVSYSKDDLLRFIRKAKKYASVGEFNESNLLNDILQAVPLFFRDGNYYRWSHKSLQDYFAAQFIWLDMADVRVVALKRMFRSKSFFQYANLLDLYADMDGKTFRQSILLDLIDQILNHYSKRLQIDSSHKFRTKELELVKCMTFGESSFFFPAELAAELGLNIKAENDHKVARYLKGLGFDLAGKETGFTVFADNGSCFFRFTDTDELRGRLLNGQPTLEIAATANRSSFEQKFFGISADRVVMQDGLKFVDLVENPFLNLQSNNLISKKDALKLKQDIEREIAGDDMDELLLRL